MAAHLSVSSLFPYNFLSVTFVCLSLCLSNLMHAGLCVVLFVPLSFKKKKKKKKKKHNRPTSATA